MLPNLLLAAVWMSAVVLAASACWLFVTLVGCTLDGLGALYVRFIRR